MNKIKSGFLLLAALFVSNFLRAQTIEDGKKFLYYERYKSAKAAFEKLVNADANNADAVYWLGQTLIAPAEGKDIAGAKALYQKALQANSANPFGLTPFSTSNAGRKSIGDRLTICSHASRVDLKYFNGVS